MVLFIGLRQRAKTWDIFDDVRNGHLLRVKIILFFFPEQINLRHGNNNLTPLHVAVASPKAGIDMSQVLVQHGADLSAKLNGVWTPLHHALWYNWRGIDWEKVLCKNGHEANVFSAAALGKTTELEEILLADPSAVNTRLQNGYTPLHFAVRMGHVNTAALLIENGADVNAGIEYPKFTPLHAALSQYNESIDLCVKLLIENGADATAETNRGVTPLHLAASGCSLVKTTERLLDAGADPEVRDDFFMSPYQIARKNGCNNIIKLFSDRSDIFVASSRGDISRVEKLLSEDASLAQARDKNGMTALHFGALRRRPEVLELLLRHGADIDAQKKSSGETPLILAFTPPFPSRYAGNERLLKTVSIFLKYKADLNAKDSEGMTALHYVMNVEEPLRGEIHELLLQAGSDKTALSNDGLRPVHMLTIAGWEDSYMISAYRGQEDIFVFAGRGNVQQLTELLTENPNLSQTKLGNGYTVLHFAAFNGHVDTADVLVQFGAQVDAPDNMGRTPLHYAAERGWKPMVKFLLAHHANPMTQDKNGITPLDLTEGDDVTQRTIQEHLGQEKVNARTP